MSRRPRSRGEARRVVGSLILALAAALSPIAAPPRALAATDSATRVGAGVLAVPADRVTGVSAWAALASSGRFSLDLYRPGVFSTQATWWYCTAASVQIMRNIDRGESDHRSSAQTRYFTYMRRHNMHRMPATDGIDPPGFLAGLRAFVDPRYRLVASSTFQNAVRSAVISLRTSGRPVALIVDRGRHAWVLTGFIASADPARTRAFAVESVRIVGPLYGRQSRNGYDPRPDTSLSVAAFAGFLNGYDFKYGSTPWDNRFVTFQV
jgi:hypothetical protein